MFVHVQFRRLVRTIQSIAVTLNRHYPARLHRLYLVDAPVIVHLPVRVSLVPYSFLYGSTDLIAGSMHLDAPLQWPNSQGALLMRKGHELPQI